MTCILVTNSLASLQLVDKIVVMNEGQVSEIGTHETLSYSKFGFYNKLLQEKK